MPRLPHSIGTMAQLFVNRLTVIDCSYLDSERGLLGESWIVDIVLSGGLDDQGMVLDFGEVKRSVKRLIDERFDHKLLVPAQHDGLIQTTRDRQLHIDFRTRDGGTIRHRSPPDAVTLIESAAVTQESMVRAIESALRPIMPANVETLSIRLSTETIEGACYQYSHGLKLHCGNCQRIAHGHRSRLLIERNGERDTALENDWCQRWHDIYIGTREDLVEQNPGEMTFAYEAEQGQFQLQLPAGHCYLIDTESTVENLAQHIADTLKDEHPGDSFRVWAFEGVDKGAIGEA